MSNSTEIYNAIACVAELLSKEALKCEEGYISGLIKTLDILAQEIGL